MDLELTIRTDERGIAHVQVGRADTLVHVLVSDVPAAAAPVSDRALWVAERRLRRERASLLETSSAKLLRELRDEGL